MSEAIDCACQLNIFEIAYTECAEMASRKMDHDTFIGISECVWSHFTGFECVDEVTVKSI